MSLTLGIETSGLVGLIALRREGQLLAEVELDHARRRHAQTLISEIQQLLRTHDVKPSDVELLAVSRGPGSFTGLRVGVVFGKVFSFATGCRLVAVDTLQAAAAAAPDEVSEVMAIADAQRDEVFVGRYLRAANGDWDRVGEVVIRSNEAFIAEAVERANASFAVTGPGLLKVAELLPPSIRKLAPEQWHPRASIVAQIGERMAARGEFSDAAEFEPFYLRKSAAEEKRDALHLSPLPFGERGRG